MHAWKGVAAMGFIISGKFGIVVKCGYTVFYRLLTSLPV